jgi:thioredoxin reductase
MKPRCQTALRLEILESRDMPSVVIVNPTTATYTDVDGDHVTLKVSTGTLTTTLFTTLATGKGDQLQAIDLSGGFDGASLTISVAKVAGGDGLATSMLARRAT